MDTNTIRYYLHSYNNLKKEIANLQESLNVYKNMNVSGLKAKTIEYSNHQSRYNKSMTETMALTRVEYVACLESEIDEKMRLLKAIDSVIFYLREPARTIIDMRYFIMPKCSWYKISLSLSRVQEIGITEENCKMIDCRVIRKIQSKLAIQKGTL